MEKLCIFVILASFMCFSYAENGVEQTIIFENSRVLKVRAVVTIHENDGIQTFIYDIPSRMETHQPAYTHRMFMLRSYPASITVRVSSQRTGTMICRGMFMAKDANYLFHHHPYVRIYENSCRLGKHILPESKDIVN